MLSFEIITEAGGGIGPGDIDVTGTGTRAFETDGPGDASETGTGAFETDRDTGPGDVSRTDTGAFETDID